MQTIEFNKDYESAILNIFNNFIDIVKNPKELNIRLNKLSSKNNYNNYFNYNNVLFLLSEFYEILPKDLEWENIIHEYMIGIRKGIEENVTYLSPALFGGLTDIGYSVHNIYKKTESYKNFLFNINKHIIKQIDFLLNKYENEVGNMPMSAYDSICGFAGQGAYLIMFKEENGVKQILERIIKLFIEMNKTIEVKGYKVSGWYIPKEKMITDIDKKLYNDGSFNLSLSHGICGPLVFMALALNEGIEVDGQKETINSILKELLKFSFKSEDGNTYWQGQLSLKEYIDGTPQIKNANRQSWCYGSVGIGRSIYIAAKSVNNHKLIGFAESVLEEVADMESKFWGLNCAHICHGYAGILAIMEAMYKDTQNIKYKKAAEKAIDAIIEKFDKNSLFGFYNYTIINRHNKTELQRFEFVDDCSFLEGSTGVILTLMSYIYINNDSWMRHLLIK